MQPHRSNLYVLAPIFPSANRSHSMMDVILVVAGAAMFFVGIAYAYACEKL
jgi:hypothetical protein